MLWGGNATTAGGWEAALVLGIIVPQSNLGSMESDMYKRILVAIDGSVTSDLALREAIGLAKDQDAMLRLVHVVDVHTDSLHDGRDRFCGRLTFSAR
jgi:K+-sensing histidine kinase KdpD